MLFARVELDMIQGPVSRWVYRLLDGMILPRGGFYSPAYDPSTEGIVECPDADPHPDRKHQRANVPGAAKYDPSKPIGALIQAAVQEQAQFDGEDPHMRREKAQERLREKKKQGRLGLADLDDILTALGIGD